jgi:hypothetical protein
MPKRENFNCETCSRESDRLFQSYQSGNFECPDCALNDSLMPPHIKARVERYITKRATALRNFGHVIKEPAAFVAAQEA